MGLSNKVRESQRNILISEGILKNLEIKYEEKVNRISLISLRNSRNRTIHSIWAYKDKRLPTQQEKTAFKYIPQEVGLA